MDPTNIGLLSALREKIRFTSERQGVLAKNIANANVPGYKAQDVDPKEFEKLLQQQTSGKVAMAVTNPAHIQGSGGSKFKIIADPNAPETTPTGNNVVLDEQAFKMSSNNTDFQTATSVYKKITDLFKLAGGSR